MNSAEGYRRELTHLSSALSRLRFQLFDVFNEENISERWESTQTAFLPVVASGKLTLKCSSFDRETQTVSQFEYFDYILLRLT